MGQQGSESDGVPTIAFQITDRHGRVLAEREPDRVFYAASTIKLAVLIAVMRAVDAGEVSLEQQLVSTHRFASVVPGGATFGMEEDEFDDGMPADGDPISLFDVLWRMIAVSSNEATNLAVGLVGLEPVTEALALCGADRSVMQRLICDLEGRDAGLTHLITAGDLVRVLSSIVGGRVASAQATRTMIGMLEDQQFGYLRAGLPAGTRVGSKSGWVQGIQHDVAFVAPSGDLEADDSYLIAVCTRGYAEDEATELLAATSKLAWDMVRAGH